MVYDWAPRLSPGQVTNLLVDIYMAQYSPAAGNSLRSEEKIVPMLWGPPGVGKTDAVKNASHIIAEKLGRKLVECTHISPTVFRDILSHPYDYFIFCDIKLERYEYSDLIGLPYFREASGIHYTDWYPPKWVAALGLDGIAGILFFDELTNAAPDAVKCAMEAIYEKKLGDIVFSPYVMIVAAGNPPEYSSVARSLPEPLMTRLAHIWVSVSPEEWIAWARENGVSESIIRFIEKNPDKISVPWLNAVPRTWAILGKAIRIKGLEKWERTLAVSLTGIDPFMEEKEQTAISDTIEVALRLAEMYRRARTFKAKLDLFKKLIETIHLALGSEYKYAVISKIGDTLKHDDHIGEIVRSYYSSICREMSPECKWFIEFNEAIIRYNIEERRLEEDEI